MKIRITINPSGKVVAMERPMPGSKSFEAMRDADSPQARVQEDPQNTVRELDLPDDFETIDDAEEFYNRMLPHLAKASA